MARDTFLVLGAGAFGGALALHLSRQGHAVVLWGHNAAAITTLTQTRRLSVLPEVVFPDNIQMTADISHAFEMVGERFIVLIVVPSFAFDDVTQQIAPYLCASTPVLWGTKGLSGSGEWLSAVCRKNTGPRPMGILSGPSFAIEVAHELPTAVTLAVDSTEWGERLQAALHSELFRVYLSTDLIGVQLGGVVKNIIAIATGMSDGLGYGANARCALVTRGLAELSRLGQVSGADPSTFMGLSGIGDMVLTCTDNQSRNRRFGLALGEGKSIDAALQAVGKVVEGKINVRQVISLARQHNINMPITEQVHAVLFENCSAEQAVEQLLARPPKKEIAN